MGKLINDKIHKKYVTHPICFRPHILSDKNIHFLGSQCHSRRLLFMEILGSEYCVQSLWENSTVRIGSFSDQISVGCRLVLVPLFAFMVWWFHVHVQFVLCEHITLICQRDKLLLVSYWNSFIFVLYVIVIYRSRVSHFKTFLIQDPLNRSMDQNFQTLCSDAP